MVLLVDRFQQVWLVELLQLVNLVVVEITAFDCRFQSRSIFFLLAPWNLIGSKDLHRIGDSQQESGFRFLRLLPANGDSGAMTGKPLWPAFYQMR